MTRPRLSGFRCDDCRCPLEVTTVIRPCPRLVVRYRACPRCGAHYVTEERVSLSRVPALAPDSGLMGAIPGDW